ncbi:MAG: GvpL/GvpF family gas vesicle protein [Chloroflexi bacterium]|nr:GvpL/GvpF family gas vesicle protein [Chloroflexota bacterium]
MSLVSSSDSSIYVYCIVKSEPFCDGAPGLRAGPIGGAADGVYAIHYMDLAAIVSNSSASRYDVSRRNMMAHQLVIEEAMARSDVLPVRFGTLAKSTEQIEERLLKRKFGEFHFLLQYVGGRVELGLKVFWDRTRLFREIAEEDRIRSLRDSIAGKSPEETHYQRIQLGQMTEEAIIRRRDQEAEALMDELRPLAVETKVNKILTDMMVLNASFLVDRSGEPALDVKVNALSEAQAGRLTLKYAGPLPPYNFVNVVVHWEDE